jgi:Dynein heavy chain C-terminal domain
MHTYACLCTPVCVCTCMHAAHQGSTLKLLPPTICVVHGNAVEATGDIADTAALGLSHRFLLQTPSLFDKEDVRERLKRLAGGPTQPLTVHLRQEIDRLNVIIRLATSTLHHLRLAIAGTIALSGNLIEAVDALFVARIPDAWLKKSWEVCALLQQHYNRQ